MSFDLNYALTLLPALLRAAGVTVLATLLGTLAAAIFGLLLALVQQSRFRPLSYCARGYIEFVRSTPFLIQLFFIFYALPAYGIAFPPLATGILALGLYFSSYLAEVYRSGIESIGRGQWEAAYALHMSKAIVWRRIILPQAIPPVVPALGNYAIAMLKASPLLATIGIHELVGTALLVAGDSYRYYEPITLVGLIFLGLSLIASVILKKIEKHYA